MSGYTDPTHHLFWLGSRATGVVAIVLVAVSVGIGLAMSSRLVRVPGLPARMKAAHEAVALTSLGAIAAHGLLLLGDSYLHPSVAEIALPFAMQGQPIWTGLGVIGGWLAAILGLSFYVRRWIGTKVWRWLHRWTLLVYVLGIAHTLGSGTDAGSAWLLAILAATALPIVFLATYRYLPGRSGKPGAPRPQAREEVRIDEVPATG
jgi:sulfoxide reductase heme-binding subunit YedZ